MPSRNVSVIILCEDTQQDVFVRQWLESKGLNSRKFRVLKNPLGRGSGEQFVRSRYPIEVEELRRVGTYSPVGLSLIVMIDADLFTVQQRHDELDRKLEEALLNPRGNDERIAILVPKRNVETWIHYMSGPTVNETDIYPKLGKPNDCKVYVKGFIERPLTPEQLNVAPTSLHLAVDEMSRVL